MDPPTPTAPSSNPPRRRPTIVAALLLLLAPRAPRPLAGVHAFGPRPPTPARRLSRRARRSAAPVMGAFRGKDEAESGSAVGAVEPFDFSSKSGWDDFYRGDGDRVGDGGGEAAAGTAAFEYEWHPRIPPSAIVEAIAPAVRAAAAARDGNDNDDDDGLPSILVVGCGNSALPRTLHDALSPVRVTCLDYSAACVDMMRERDGPDRPRMDFVVGDATRLGEALDATPAGGERHRQYDVIVDKGLLDALMCSEGFDSDVERMMGGIIDGVLTDRGWGTYVLVCFRLSGANREWFAELGRRGGVGVDDGGGGSKEDGGLEWEFDVPVEGAAGGRASLNMARRVVTTGGAADPTAARRKRSV